MYGYVPLNLSLNHEKQTAEFNWGSSWHLDFQSDDTVTRSDNDNGAFLEVFLWTMEKNWKRRWTELGVSNQFHVKLLSIREMECGWIWYWRIPKKSSKSYLHNTHSIPGLWYHVTSTFTNTSSKNKDKTLWMVWYFSCSRPGHTGGAAGGACHTKSMIVGTVCDIPCGGHGGKNAKNNWQVKSLCS